MKKITYIVLMRSSNGEVYFNKDSSFNKLKREVSNLKDCYCQQRLYEIYSLEDNFEASELTLSKFLSRNDVMFVARIDLGDSKSF